MYVAIGEYTQQDLGINIEESAGEVAREEIGGDTAERARET